MDHRLGELSPDDIVASGIADEAKAERALRSDASVAAGLPRLKISTLLIVGEADAVVSPANSLEIAGALVRHRSVLEPGAGYAVLVQDEQQLLPLLVSFAIPS